MSTRLISMAAVLDLTSLSRTSLYRMIAAGTFPKSVPIGTSRVAFLESEVESWIADRIEARAA